MATPDDKHGYTRDVAEENRPTVRNGDSIEAVEINTPDGQERDTLQRMTTKDSTAHRASQDIRRTASNVLTNVASRITTRTWPEPPPPPDGGLKAWTQVAMGWLVMVGSIISFRFAGRVPPVIS